MLIKNNKIKIIFHIDMNAYFASVAAILNPALKNEVFAIGKASSINGMITCPSYAARKLGIKAAMLQPEALRICPKLVIVEPRYEKYQEYHEKFVNYIKKYTPIIQVASIDELYADMTEACEQTDVFTLASKIQNGLLKEVGLPCSIGIAPTLFLAKMASDMKKPMGITVLRKKDVSKKILPLDLDQMYGIGKKSATRLKNKGINFIGELIKPENKEKVLRVLSPLSYSEVLNYLKGLSSNIVDPQKYAISESIGVSRTFEVALEHEVDLQKKLEEQVNIIHKRLRKEKLVAKTITLTLKNTTYKTINRSKSLPNYTDDKEVIHYVLLDLLDDNFSYTSYRLLGASLSNLIRKEKIPLEYNLFTYEKFIAKDELVDETIKKINNKYNKNLIVKGIKM